MSKKNTKKDVDNIIIQQQRILINKQKEYIEILKKHNDTLSELNNFFEFYCNKFYKEYKSELLVKYKDADLMVEAFLIQARRWQEKKRNSKLKRFSDYQALIYANEKLKKFRIEELVYTPFDINKKIAPTELLIKIQQNYSRTYKKRFLHESGKYLPIMLSFQESPNLIFFLPD